MAKKIMSLLSSEAFWTVVAPLLMAGVICLIPWRGGGGGGGNYGVGDLGGFDGGDGGGGDGGGGGE